MEQRRAVTRFEDLVVWQRARALTGAVYSCTRKGGFARDFGLSSQIQRAAVSIMANIAEGFERRRPAEFARFLEIAKASNAEVSSHLFVALDNGYLHVAKFDELQTGSRELGSMLGRFIASVRNSDVARRSPLGTRNPEPNAGTRDSGLGTRH